VDDLKELTRRLNESEATILRMNQELDTLFKEVQTYRNAARLYGIDPATMLTLAKSQVKTCADNIRLIEKMQEVFQQQEMTDAKNVTGAQQGEEETDTVSKIETTQNSENEVVSDEKAGSSEISEESNSESAVQDTEASETQTTEKTQQTWGSIGGYYTVKRGDTLAGISKKMYQSYNYIEMIAEANGIDNVDEIYPGQILEIPQIED
jgi:nucleoid-associated protein YgaU